MPAPIRSIVKDNRIISSASPAVRLQIDPTLTYAGNQEFLLYGIALAEQYLFIGADSQNRVQRLVWVQFESFIEGNHRTYDYSSSQHIEITGWPFYYDAGWMDRAVSIRERPDSDGAKMAAFLENKGFLLTDVEILERYVTLTGDRRSELMLIYSEDAAMHGLTPEALNTGGDQGEPWIHVIPGLHARGLSSFRIESEYIAD
jgi:hypothetical protein